jgi:hypothetical protein
MKRVKFKGYWVYENGTIEGKKGIRKLSLNRNGYLQLTMMDPVDYTKRKNYSHHRFIWEAFNTSIKEGLHVDHIDGDRLNNHISNLRLLTPAENMKNRKFNKLS